MPDIKIIVIDGDDAAADANDSHTINSENDNGRPDAITAEKYVGGGDDDDDNDDGQRSVDQFNVDDLLVAYRNYRRLRHRRIVDRDIIEGHQLHNIDLLGNRSRHQQQHHCQHHHHHHPRRHLRQYCGDYFNDYEDYICENDGGDCSDEENDDEPHCSCEHQQHIHRHNRFALLKRIKLHT